MWGTLADAEKAKLCARFIPTHVGYMLLGLCSVFGDSVHPHACGVHIIDIYRVKSAFGSSPRMWGTYLIILPQNQLNIQA